MRKYNHIAIYNKLINLGIAHQLPLTSQKERESGNMCLLMEKRKPTVMCSHKKLSPNLMQPLDSPTNLQEMQRTEKYLKLHQRDAICVIHTMKNSKKLTTSFFCLFNNNNNKNNCKPAKEKNES